MGLALTSALISACFKDSRAFSGRLSFDIVVQ